LLSIIRKSKNLISPLLLFTVVLSCLCSTVFAANGKTTQEVEEKVWNWYFKGEVVEKSLFKSKIIGVTYPYHVYLPASYANNTDKAYPIMYVMDGQWNFKPFAYALESGKRDVIVVAIEDSNRRSIDYSLPGAMLYLDFFRQEFLPLIESAYRIDTSNRSFQGFSLSGIISTALLFLDDPKAPLFKNILADDAAYWHNPELMQNLIEKRLKIDNRIESNLYLTTATPFMGNHFPVMNFIESLEGHDIPGLNIYHEWYLTTHGGVVWESVYDTLDLIYGKSKL
jgi:hypothetical protein